MKIAAVLVVSSLMIFLNLRAQPQKVDSALISVVESERAFARKSLEVGSRAAFMMFFADDAMVFRPHPVKYKEATRTIPLPKNPLETTLEWEPIWADVSKDGDLGYTTGPSVWTDHTPAKRPTYYGFYFSFWKRQPTGEWKVVFDVGTELPGPYTSSRTLAFPSLRKSAAKPPTLDAAGQRSSLLQAEKDFHSLIKKAGVDAALRAILDNEARVYRQKVLPMIGIDSICTYFSRQEYLSAWEPMGCEVSTSGDLGYCYGSYAVNGTERSAGGKGYFLHGWKRDALNEWKLIAEIISLLPPEAQKPKQ
jgi:ketosteroid isomerase-like protein